MLYSFQSFELDTDQLEFRAAHKVRPLEPQVFDVLRHLVANADRVISRDELIAVVWAGRAISDATISSRINAARTALGDSGKRQALIKTVPRRGFRFLGNVTAINRAKIGGEVGNGVRDADASQPHKPGIAVLPFNNMSDDPGQEYFADGLVEDIITALSKVSRLRVIARNSSFTYKRRSEDVRKVAHELDVRYVLEGSVRSDGHRIRVTAQLIDADDSSHIWAERYDRPPRVAIACSRRTQ
jgi:TolB-like protein